MLTLPTVTLVCFATTGHTDAAYAFERSKQGIEYRNHIVLTDQPQHFVHDAKTVFLSVEPLPSYHHGCVIQCTKSFDWLMPLMGSHVLSVQHDGFVIHPELWDDEFLAYDMVGAPMFGHTVGNHGFALFGRAYYEALRKLKLPPALSECHPCDQIICMRHRAKMEALGCRFAPLDLANRFSQENVLPVEGFGFHGKLSLQDVKEQGLY